MAATVAQEVSMYPRYVQHPVLAAVGVALPQQSKPRLHAYSVTTAVILTTMLRLEHADSASAGFFL